MSGNRVAGDQVVLRIKQCFICIFAFGRCRPAIMLALMLCKMRANRPLRYARDSRASRHASCTDAANMLQNAELKGNNDIRSGRQWVNES